MLLYQAYTTETTTHPYMVKCQYCGERKRFDVAQPALIACNCTVAARRFVNQCPIIRGIRGKVTAHKCGSKCTHAKGGDCECSCGGENHGKGW